jgi:hypothetical protein
MCKIKIKNSFSWRTRFVSVTALVVFSFSLFTFLTRAQVPRQINLTASLLQSDGTVVTDGEVDIRFALYALDRSVTDTYPSDSDSASRVWVETQKVIVKNGIIVATLGAVTPLPEQFTNGSDYFLGVRVDGDSEMIPRKKFNSAFAALNAAFAEKSLVADTAVSANSLLGKVLGVKIGNIPTLGKSGKMILKMLPVGTGTKQLVLGGDTRLHKQNTDTGTTADSFVIGSGIALSSHNFDIAVSSATSKPSLRYNGTSSVWQLSNNGLTFTNINGGAIDLVSGVTGVLPVVNGGTGLNTSASTGVPIITAGTWSVTTTLGVAQGGTGAATLTSNGVLLGNTTGAVTATSAGTNGQLLLGVTSGAPAFATMSGDATITNAGVLTVAANAVALATDTTGNYVQSISTSVLTGLTGGLSAAEGTDHTLAFDYSATLAGNPALAVGNTVFGTTGLIFEGATANTFEALLTVVDPTADNTYTLPDVSGTVITTGNLSAITTTGTITSGVWNGTAIAAQYGGTGLNTSASTGVPIITAGTWSVTTTLGVAQGGTGASSVGSAGSLAYSTGSAYGFSAVGTAGQALVSGGAGTPTFFAPTLGSVLFATTSGALAQDNTNFFWDDTNNYLGIGDLTPNNQLDLLSSAAINNGLIITNTNAGSYNPNIQFELVEGTPLFTFGVDDSDSDKFKISIGSDITGTNQFTIDSTGLVSIGSLSVGAQSFDSDAGIISWIDMPVTSSATVGTVESYTAQLDGNALLTVYGESDGAGSIQNYGVSIGNATLQSGAKFATTQTSTSTTGATMYNVYNSMSDTGIVTTGTDTTYGNYTILTRTGATGGTIDSYGSYITATADNAGAGTSTLYGQYVTVSGADTNYSGIFTGGNFGIGDTSPLSLLTVGSGDLFQVNSSGAIAAAVGITSSSNYQQTAGTFALTSVTATGNISSITDNSLTSGTAQSIASSATAFTGSLLDITLSGSNSANTGTLAVITNSGTNNTNTSLYVKHYATGTNNLAFRVDDVSGDTTPFVIDGAGNVGIGIAAPGNLLEVYGTGTQLKISYDGTNYATMAVDSTGYLSVASFGKKIQMLDENLWVCGGGTCPAVTPAAGQGNIIVENGVYFGNGFKAQQISATELGVYNSTGALVVTFDETP